MPQVVFNDIYFFVFVNPRLNLARPVLRACIIVSTGCLSHTFVCFVTDLKFLCCPGYFLFVAQVWLNPQMFIFWGLWDYAILC